METKKIKLNELREMVERTLMESDFPIPTKIAIFSHLSDIQEQYPEIRQKINFVKKLILKLNEGVTEMANDELNQLYSETN